MNSVFTPIEPSRLRPGVQLAYPLPESARTLTLESPALEVMTSLRDIAAARVGSRQSIPTCNKIMVARNVRLLFIEDMDGMIIGVITAMDILGERLIRLVREQCAHVEELTAMDLMTPTSSLEAIDIETASRARVGHIVATLQAAGRQYIFVTEGGVYQVCGIFSAASIARRLPVNGFAPEFAQKFAYLEPSLGH